MIKLPFLISIPHGGYKTPQELEDISIITPHDLLEDGDAYATEIFDIGFRARKIIKFNIARAFVDLNRAPDDLPPDNPDGVVKSMTCYGKPIYKNDIPPSGELLRKILNKYYFSYHKELEEALKDNRIEIAFDCHTMAETSPSIAPDNGKRPLFTLGDYHGNACDREITEVLAEAIRNVFKLKENEVTINEPFAGGYITRSFGNNPKPVIQIEMNRSLYLKEPWFNKNWLEIDRERLKELNLKFETALETFYKINEER